MPGMKRWILSAALALLVAESAAAQTQRTRPLATIGYNAAERREAEARADRQAAEINRLATQNGISRRLVRAVAVEVGLTNRQFSDAQLLRAVESAVERARELQADNTRLREEIGRLRDPALRDPALTLLAQAESALEEGRLEEAERRYGQLAELRWGESSDALDTWISAVRAQASAAELQGSAEAFERAAMLTRQARNLARQQRERMALLEHALTIEDMQRWLREGKNFGRRRGLENAIAVFEEELAEVIARDPLADQWIPAHLTYVRSQSLLAEREGGEIGEARLALAMLHLIVASQDTNNPGGDTARLPLQLQFAFVDVVFDRFRLMTDQEIFSFFQSPMSAHLQRSLEVIVAETSLNFSDGLSTVEFDRLNLVLRSLAPFLRRADIVIGLEQQGGGAVAAMLRNLNGVVAIATSGMTVALSGNATVQPLIDPQAEPERWMENALLAADAYAFEAQSGTSETLFQRMGLPDRRHIAWQGILLAMRAGDLAAERDNTPILAQATHLLGHLTLIMASHSSGAELDTLLRHSRSNFMTARALRPAVDQPLAWADSTIGLGQLYVRLSQHQPANQCVHLVTARDLLESALPIVMERRPAHAWQSVQREQDHIASLLEGQCAAALGALDAAGEAAAVPGQAAASEATDVPAPQP